MTTQPVKTTEQAITSGTHLHGVKTLGETSTEDQMTGTTTSQRPSFNTQQGSPFLGKRTSKDKGAPAEALPSKRPKRVSQDKPNHASEIHLPKSHSEVIASKGVKEESSEGVHDSNSAKHDESQHEDDNDTSEQRRERR